MGLLDDLEKAAMFHAMVQASKDHRGKPSAAGVTGMALGMGMDLSAGDAVILGSMLLSEGAFDPDDDPL